MWRVTALGCNALVKMGMVEKLRVYAIYYSSLEKGSVLMIRRRSIWDGVRSLKCGSIKEVGPEKREKRLWTRI